MGGVSCLEENFAKEVCCSCCCGEFFFIYRGTERGEFCLPRRMIRAFLTPWFAIVFYSVVWSQNISVLDRFCLLSSNASSDLYVISHSSSIVFYDSNSIVSMLSFSGSFPARNSQSR